MRKEIYSGWVELREPKLVPERLRRPVFEKSVSGQAFANVDGEVNEEAMKFFGEFNDLLVVAMVSEWSFGSEISLESLLDLPGRAYDDVRQLVTPYLVDLIPDFGADVDPKATTEN